MKTIAYSLIIAYIILIVCCFFFGTHRRIRKYFIGFIYLITIVYTICIGIYFANAVQGASPDESAHIAYIYYLNETKEIIPQYEDMHIFSDVIMKWSEEPNYEYQTYLINYLCHPPLYYHIMRLAGGFTPTESDVVITIDKMRLRYFSMGIYTIGLILLLYIGWSRINREKPWLHLLYATAATSIPMIGYELCGVTNDALTLITASLCILGLIRFCEGKRNYLTYALIATGITASLLTKLTTAMLCIFMAMIVLIVTIVKEKSIKGSLRLEFFITFPIYFFAIAYYAIIYNRYGTIHPSLELISSAEYFKNTMYYINEADRVRYTLSEYLSYYFDRFFLSWSGIESTYRFLKTYTYSLTAIPYEILWLMPVLLFLPHAKKIAGTLTLPLIAGWVSLILTFIYQLKSAYGTYLTRGYLGGFASRYYIPFMPIFGLCMIVVFQSLLTDNGFDPLTDTTTIKDNVRSYYIRLLYNQLIYVLTLIFGFLLFYGNLPFFLLHYAPTL